SAEYPADNLTPGPQAPRRRVTSLSVYPLFKPAPDNEIKNVAVARSETWARIVRLFTHPKNLPQHLAKLIELEVRLKETVLSQAQDPGARLGREVLAHDCPCSLHVWVV